MWLIFFAADARDEKVAFVVAFSAASRNSKTRGCNFYSFPAEELNAGTAAKGFQRFCVASTLPLSQISPYIACQCLVFALLFQLIEIPCVPGKWTKGNGKNLSFRTYHCGLCFRNDVATFRQIWLYLHRFYGNYSINTLFLWCYNTCKSELKMFRNCCLWTDV